MTTSSRLHRYERFQYPERDKNKRVQVQWTTKLTPVLEVTKNYCNLQTTVLYKLLYCQF